MSDYLGELERLQALRERGAVTDDEFQQEKAKLLAGVSRTPASRESYGLDRAGLQSLGIRFTPYPGWVMALLSFITLGIYTAFWLNHWHGVMPKHRPDDPSTAKAIWFLFIPLFGIYWLFESLLRLCTRLDEELAEAGLPDRVPKELVRWYCIFYLVPYVDLVAAPILGAIATWRLQSLVNLLAKVDSPTHRS